MKSDIPLTGYTHPWDGKSYSTESQGFGTNPDLYKKFGLLGHNGHDDRYIKVNSIHPTLPVLPLEKRFIRAIEGGIAVRGRWDDPNSPGGGYGQYVRIYTTRNESKLNLPAGVAHVDRVYGHMGQLAYNGDIFECDGIWIKEGQRVETGQIIGIEGSTGNSTGPHCHRGRRFLNAQYEVINYNNGYFGYEEAYDDLLLNEDTMIEFVQNMSRPGEYGILVSTSVGSYYTPASTEEDLKKRMPNVPLNPDGAINYSLARPIQL